MSKKKELFGNTAVIFIGKMLPQVLSFFMLYIYTNYLSTAEYGTADLIVTYVALFAPIITLQLEMAIFRFLVDSRDNDDEKKKLITNNYICVILLTLIFAIIYLVITSIIHFKFIWIILFYIVSTILISNGVNIARGLGRNKVYAVANILNGVTLVFNNIFFIVIMGYGMNGMIFALALSNLMAFIYLFIKLKLHKYINFKIMDKKTSKELIKYSLPLIPNGISWWIINVSDRTIVSIFLGTAANGIYAISNKFPSILSNLGTVYSLSWTESASLYINDKDRDSFFSDICNNSLRIFGCLSILLIAVVPFAFPIIFNANFDESYIYIPILITASLCNSIVIGYNAIYIAKKLTKEIAVASIISAIINILINLALINYIGIYAAAFSTLITYFVLMVYRHFDVQKYIKIKYKVSLIAAIVIMLGISILIYYINHLYLNIISLVICIIFSIIMNKNLLKSILGYLLDRSKYEGIK